MVQIMGFLLLIRLMIAAQVTNGSDVEKIVIGGDVFVDRFVKYTAEYDIVNLLSLLDINFGHDEDNLASEETALTLYFVEADVKKNGVKNYKGLYTLRNGVATKILETGTDASASNDDTNKVFLSAQDGIYVYDSKLNKTDKYGSVTESFISILKPNDSDILYVLSEDHEVYKITNAGTKKEKLENVKDAQQIVLDYKNNMYYYGQDKVPYVVTENGIKKIEGLPANPSYVQLIKPPSIVEDGAIFASDDALYFVYLNRTSELTDFVLEAKPSAYFPENTLIQYYGYNKKIYEYNILELVLIDYVLDVTDKSEMIQTITTHFRSKLKA